MNWDAPLKLKPCCLNLRHKMMYCDPRQATPGAVDDSSDTRVYLCMISQEVLGPDGKTVSPTSCCAGRSCYKAPAPQILRVEPSAAEEEEAVRRS